MAMEENQNKTKEAVAEIAPFDPADDSLDTSTEKTENLSVFEITETAFSGLKKKKKKKKPTNILDNEKENVGDHLDDHTFEEEEGVVLLQQQRLPSEGTQRDKEYDELLGRVFNTLHEYNSELAGDRRRIVMRPPKVLREGTKKTVFVNFMDLCRTFPRVRKEHVVTFLLAELGTSGSLDGQQRLVLKGRFAPKHFEGIQRRYVNEYVICNACKSPDTILSNESRILFLKCDKCGAKRSVAPIKAGFQARVDRRKASIT